MREQEGLIFVIIIFIRPYGIIYVEPKEGVNFSAGQKAFFSALVAE
jgi:hypothetical protein